MAECEWLALVTFARIENWQDCQGGLARVATAWVAARDMVNTNELVKHFEETKAKDSNKMKRRH
jgi:hypothetical protein